jgi:hypothetical protein
MSISAWSFKLAGGLSLVRNMLLNQTMEKIDPQPDHLELERFKP